MAKKKRQLKRDAVKTRYYKDSDKVTITFEWEKAPIPMKDTICRRIPLSLGTITSLWDHLTPKQQFNCCLKQSVITEAFIEERWNELDDVTKEVCVERYNLSADFIIADWDNLSHVIQLEVIAHMELPIPFIMEHWPEFSDVVRWGCWIYQRLFYRLTKAQLPMFLTDREPQVRVEANKKMRSIHKEGEYAEEKETEEASRLQVPLKC